MQLNINPNNNDNKAQTFSFGPDNTPYDAIGGDQQVRALVDAFYDHLDNDDRFKSARAVYPEDLAEPRDKLYEFLSGWLGGPQLYIQKRGHPRLRARHMPFSIGEAERDAWLACMNQAMDDRHITGELREFLEARFTHVADFMRNK
jgi:hemoglobin